MLLTATRIDKHADFTLLTNNKLHVKHAYSQAAALTKPLLDILRGFRGQDPLLVALLQAHLASVIDRVPDYVGGAVGHEPIHRHQAMVTFRDLSLHKIRKESVYAVRYAAVVATPLNPPEKNATAPCQLTILMKGSYKRWNPSQGT